MNSYERVKAALEFKCPDRVPILRAGLGLDILPMPMMPSNNWHPGHRDEEKGLFPHPIDDILFKARIYRWKKPEWAKQNKAYKGIKWMKLPREEIDEWGCIWNRSGKNTSMGHPGRASLNDWNHLDDYLEKYNPIAKEKSHYSLFLKLAKLIGKNKYRMCTLGHVGPSQTASMIRGFNNYLMDHRKSANKPYLHKLLSHLTDFYLECMDYWIKYGAKPHGFMLVDDLGEQSGPFFSPKIFKEFYEPVYKRIFDRAHELGCTTYLHCCGNVSKLLPNLIEWGLDAIEFDSPRMSNYNDLAEFRGKIMFWGCVNIQSIYTQGTPDECEREVWHMMRNLGTENGGFGAYFYPQVRHIKAPKENIKAFDKGLKKYGIYNKIPKEWWEYPVSEEWKDNIVPPLPPFPLKE